MVHDWLVSSMLYLSGGASAHNPLEGDPVSGNSPACILTPERVINIVIFNQPDAQNEAKLPV